VSLTVLHAKVVCTHTRWFMWWCPYTAQCDASDPFISQRRRLEWVSDIAV